MHSKQILSAYLILLLLREVFLITTTLCAAVNKCFLEILKAVAKNILDPNLTRKRPTVF